MFRSLLASVEAARRGEGLFFGALLSEERIDGCVRAAREVWDGWVYTPAVTVWTFQHQSRRTDFRRGRRLGPDDHVVTWTRTARPEGIHRETYERLPERLEMREIRIRVEQPGFRTDTLVVATTLLDADEYPREEIADLYRQRWHAELDLRNLKTALAMEHLRCRAPHRVRNEIRMHLLAHNLIRRVMATAARQADLPPRWISFKAALRTLGQFLPAIAHSAVPADTWLHELLRAVATHVVGQRPDRREPRRVKKRLKPFKLMTKPRHEYQHHGHQGG